MAGPFYDNLSLLQVEELPLQCSVPSDWDVANLIADLDQSAVQSTPDATDGSDINAQPKGQAVPSPASTQNTCPSIINAPSTVPHTVQQPHLPKPGARFTVSVVKTLRSWFANHEDNPFPSAKDIEFLQAQTGLEKKQILNWFANTRRRSKPQAFRSSSPVPWKHGQSTAPVDIPPRRPTPIPFENMNPMERWESSPPEHEGAALFDISRAIATYPTKDLGQISSRNSIASSANESWASGDGTSCSSRDINSDSSAYSFSSHSMIGTSTTVKRPNPRRRRRRLAKRAVSYVTKLHKQLDIFQCTFCTETFKTKYDWQRHEKSLHLPIEKWTCCREDSPIRDTDKGRLCIFCGEVDPSEAHLQSHNVAECLGRPREERTFYRKDHLRQHLKLVHATSYSEPLMKDWKMVNDEIKSRCGFCELLMTSWTSRIHHLAEHFEKGCTMGTWKGEWGFDDDVNELVENAMPPYLISLEQISPLPFSPEKGPVETPANPYELLGVELEYYMQDRMDTEGRVPSDTELQYEACSIVFAADTFSRISVNSAPSWLRDIIMSSDEIVSRAHLRPMTHCRTRVSQLTINGKGNIFEHCGMELELRAFVSSHHVMGLSVSDHEIRQEALNVVNRTHALLSNDFKRFYKFIGRLILDSDRWLSLLRQRVEQSPLDLPNNNNTGKEMANFAEDRTTHIQSFDLISNPGIQQDWRPSDLLEPADDSPSPPTISPQALFSPNVSWTGPTRSSGQLSGLRSSMTAASPLNESDLLQDNQRHTSGWSKQTHFHNASNSYWALFKDLTRFVQRTTSVHNPDRHVPSDEELKYQARWIWCGDGDPWNHTPADNDQWLKEFKRKAGILDDGDSR